MAPSSGLGCKWRRQPFTSRHHMTSVLAVATLEFTDPRRPYYPVLLTFPMLLILVLHLNSLVSYSVIVPLHASACTTSFTLHPAPLLTRDNISNSTTAFASIPRANQVPIESSCNSNMIWVVFLPLRRLEIPRCRGLEGISTLRTKGFKILRR